MNQIRKHTIREEGATAVEYGIMVALIAVVIILAVVALGNTTKQAFDETCKGMGNAPTIECKAP